MRILHWLFSFLLGSVGFLGGGSMAARTLTNTLRGGHWLRFGDNRKDLLSGAYWLRARWLETTSHPPTARLTRRAAPGNNHARGKEDGAPLFSAQHSSPSPLPCSLLAKSAPRRSYDGCLRLTLCTRRYQKHQPCNSWAPGAGLLSAEF